MFPRQTALATSLFVLACTAASLSHAQPDVREGRRPPPPPQEAIDACNGKHENALCSFTGRRNDVVKGRCISQPEMKPLMCAPEGGPPDHPPRFDRSD